MKEYDACLMLLWPICSCCRLCSKTCIYHAYTAGCLCSRTVHTCCRHSSAPCGPSSVMKHIKSPVVIPYCLPPSCMHCRLWLTETPRVLNPKKRHRTSELTTDLGLGLDSLCSCHLNALYKSWHEDVKPNIPHSVDLRVEENFGMHDILSSNSA